LLITEGAVVVHDELRVNSWILLHFACFSPKI
jgi:hypothetical protein